MNTPSHAQARQLCNCSWGESGAIAALTLGPLQHVRHDLQLEQGCRMPAIAACVQKLPATLAQDLHRPP